MAVGNAALLGVGLGAACADVVESINAILKRAYNDHTVRGGGEGAGGHIPRKEKVTVSCAADIVAFWESQDPILADAIMPYLWFPITAANIECTSNLAGLIDANNWQKMSSSLHKAAVGMYCNGDVECRFVDIKPVVLFCPCSLL